MPSDSAPISVNCPGRTPAGAGAVPVVMLTSFPTLHEQGEDVELLRSLFGAGRVVELVHDVPRGSVVIPRFRAIPFGDLLQREVEAAGSALINSFHQHRNIADSSAWSHLLDGLTPPSYELAELPYLPDGEWFVKGETNSLKNRWKDACYASSKQELIEVVGNFQRDALVGNQRVVIKPFVRFRQLRDAHDVPLCSLSGQPLWHERRVFALDARALSCGFYWETFADDVQAGWGALDEGLFDAALSDALARVGHLARFMVIDLAEREDGTWMVIELNDGCMAGLCGNTPQELWGGLLARLKA